MEQTRPFRPTWWLRGPHLETIWPAILCRRPRFSVERERLELPDGDFVDLDWLAQTRHESDAPLVVAIHGLEGGVRSHYVVELFHALLAVGGRGVLLNLRGSSGEPNRRPRAQVLRVRARTTSHSDHRFG